MHLARRDAAQGADGAGAFATGTNFTLVDSTVSENHGNAAGGGLYLSTSVVTLTSSTIISNRAVSDGGGILQFMGQLTATNTTLSANRSSNNGGGITVQNGTLNAYNLTIADNVANADNTGGDGGGLYVAPISQVTLYNTLVISNYGADVGHNVIDDDCSGSFGTFHYSLFGTTAGCFFTNDHTQTGANAHLLPLAANGGPTLTRALGLGSAALDAGNPAGCANPLGGLLLFDQRHFVRPVDGNRDGQARCDIGAFEAPVRLFLPLLRR